MKISPSLLRGAALAGFALLSVAGLAHVRLTNPNNGNPLYWAEPSNVGIVISSIGSDDIADATEDTALRNAFDAWNEASGSTAQLVEDASAETRARTDWSSSSIHMIWFDEDNSSSYFPGGSSTVAITPVWFYSSGMIDDADVLFNGMTYSFTTSGEPGRFDVQDVATHELGHLLGLDHSGWAGATMYPYVDSTVILHRSLARDDVGGLRVAYPEGSFATISGTVKRVADDTVVAGAHLVVRDETGRPVGATLSGVAGTFQIGGLDAGTYELYANPLDHPVGAANLGASWVIETDFESTAYGSVVVTAGEAKSIGDFPLEEDVTVSLGRNTDRYPLRCTQGTSTAWIVRGSGLVDGSTLTASDPDITVMPISWFTSQVSFSVTVPGGEPPGHADLVFTDPAGDRSILVAGLEITPPDPVVTLVSPNQADVAGGTEVTIVGSEFGAGARVVFGGEVYEDGAPGGCTVANPTTITLTTRPSPPGISDVVVIDATGVEGRKASGFQFLAVPYVETVFPVAGDASGGTEVVLTGGNFAPGAVVRIAGVAQSEVTLVSSTRLLVLTEGGVAGGPYLLEVENPGGSVASSLFGYSAQPDPQVVAVAPESGTAAGGETVTISGSGFPADARVVFGADPETGDGGVVSPSVVVSGSTALEVTTPAFGGAVGPVSVLVESTGSGQADVLSGGFSFVAAGGGGGGGGGCGTAPVPGPRGPGRLIGPLLWVGCVVVGLRAMRRKRVPVRVRVR